MGLLSESAQRATPLLIVLSSASAPSRGSGSIFFAQERGKKNLHPASRPLTVLLFRMGSQGTLTSNPIAA